MDAITVTRHCGHQETIKTDIGMSTENYANCATYLCTPCVKAALAVGDHSRCLP